MRTSKRRRRALIRNALVFAGFAALAVLLGVPAKADEPQQVHANAEGGNVGGQNVPGVRFS